MNLRTYDIIFYRISFIKNENSLKFICSVTDLCRNRNIEPQNNKINDLLRWSQDIKTTFWNNVTLNVHIIVQNPFNLSVTWTRLQWCIFSSAKNGVPFNFNSKAGIQAFYLNTFNFIFYEMSLKLKLKLDSVYFVLFRMTSFYCRN